MRIENRMYREIEKLNRVPESLRTRATTWLLGRFVPFTRTSGLVFEKVSREEVIVSIQNRRKVQNHIQGVHACAMALLAETSSGFVTNMNTPDDKLILLKSMHVDYEKRAVGNMRAVARCSEEMAQIIFNEERGNFAVPVTVYDESGEPPVNVEMVWAWVPKKKKEDNAA